MALDGPVTRTEKVQLLTTTLDHHRRRMGAFKLQGTRYGRIAERQCEVLEAIIADYRGQPDD